MSRQVLINALRFILLVLIQVLLLKNMSVYNMVTPQLYILFILLLPFEVPNLLLFALAFAMGLTIDAFNNTPGLNAAACVMLALGRILFIRLTVQRDGFENEPEPTPGIMGFTWFFTYSAILTLLHHFFLFNLEVFKLTELQYTLGRCLLSSVFTVFLVMISGWIFFSKKVR
jgi:rod shape-determining protein MreD